MFLEATKRSCPWCADVCVQVAAVEVLARDALAAVCTPLRRLPAVHAGGLAAAQLLCGALARALALVEQVAE